MAKTTSKTTQKTAQPKPQPETKAKIETALAAKSAVKTSKPPRRVLAKLTPFKQKWQKFRGQPVRLHKSFRRSYAEDYRRETKTPGLLSHAMLTFKTIFQHWRVFLPFMALIVCSYIVAVGLMSEDFYQQFQTAIDETSAQIGRAEIGNFARAGLLLVSTVTTGGLVNAKSEVQVVFSVIVLLIVWLVTLYLLRHFMAGEHPKLRDGLYNALGPLISTGIIFAIIFVQAIPLMLVIITYSAAVATGFLATPFYALLYFIFAALMLLLSGYLLSSSLMALIAVTTPGLYPLRALFAASDLMAGRRIKFVIRIIYGVIVISLLYIIVMMPVILIDLWVKSAVTGLSWPIVPFFLLVTTSFVFIYATTYLYLYYRWLLDYQPEN